MAKFIIEGGKKLQGKVRISGNKNAVFPCMAAALLTSEKVILRNVPNIADTKILIEIMQALGVQVKVERDTVEIVAQKIVTTELPEILTNKLRGSILFAGALLSRMGEVSFSHPGGDIIGKRSIEVHLDGFEQLGSRVRTSDRYYNVVANDKSNSERKIFLEFPSVTGTEILILASVLKKGSTTLKNCTQEPHVVDLCEMLAAMGAKISGIGTQTLEITGVETLHGVEYTLGPDYIEVGTYAITAGLTRGEIEISGCRGLDTDPILWPLEKMGLEIKKQEGIINVSARQLGALSNLRTNIWPGFPTDLMSVMIVLATQANGVSLLHDWIYESRMFFVDKLISMGAHITIADPHRVLVYGPSKLMGRNLETPDIRAGMALVLAALVASGRSEINRAELIDRGYEDVVGKLSALGANIHRVD